MGESDVEQEIHYINYASTHALEANVSGICNIEVLRNMLYTTVQNPEGATNQAFSCDLHRFLNVFINVPSDYFKFFNKNEISFLK